MTVYGTTIPGAARIARWATTVEHLTPDVRRRLTVLDWHRAYGRNVSLTARHFALRRGTIREWARRFQATGLFGLVERSRRPHRVRRPTTTPAVIQQIVALRRQYPSWSKSKLQVLLSRAGVIVSVSTVGRVLNRRGLVDRRVSRKRRRAARHPRARFPRGLKIACPGDLVQIDVKYIVLTGGRYLYQFTAIDVLTKWRVLRVYPSFSSRNGAAFLAHCRATFPFSVRAVQTDNGSTFQKEFVRAVAEAQLTHYFIEPRQPKQNAYVEVSHGADEREFYQLGNVWSDLMTMRQKIHEWQQVWNEVRPHQALNYLTPLAYLTKWRTTGLPTRDIITLQT